MILGIGTDIVRVSRLAAGLRRFGERYARRILTPEEYREYRHHPRPAHFLAKRFAAKEAAAKAFGTGFRDGLSLRHIGVGHDPQGRPLLRYYGAAQRLQARLGIGASHVSVADEDDYAIAFVTLTAPGPTA